jgi:hypothetical protein
MPRHNEKISEKVGLRSNRLIWLALVASPMLLILAYLLVMMVSFGGSEMTGLGQ